jgi:hypothetical protein
MSIEQPSYRPRLIVISGPSGCGKTNLSAEFAKSNYGDLEVTRLNQDLDISDWAPKDEAHLFIIECVGNIQQHILGVIRKTRKVVVICETQYLPDLRPVEVLFAHKTSRHNNNEMKKLWNKYAATMAFGHFCKIFPTICESDFINMSIFSESEKLKNFDKFTDTKIEKEEVIKRITWSDGQVDEVVILCTKNL